MIRKSDFKPLNGAAYSVYKKYAPYWGESCERSWANLLLYNSTYHWCYAEIGGRLYVASFDESYMFFPLGELIAPQELQRELKSFAECCGGEISCGDAPYDYLEHFPQASELMAFKDDPGDYDYIYNVDHLCSYSGSRLRKRHNQVRQFERAVEGEFFVKEITFDMLPEICELAANLSVDYWQDSSGLEEKLAFEQLPRVWEQPESRLYGTALYAGRFLAGFSIFSMLDSQLADIHFEKADRSYPGCGAKVTDVLTKYLQQLQCRFMNREQDLNEVGLRRAKEALDPDHLYRRLSINCS